MQPADLTSSFTSVLIPVLPPSSIPISFTPTISSASQFISLRKPWGHPAIEPKKFHFKRSRSLRRFKWCYQLGRTLKDYSNSGASHGVNWVLSCSYIMDQFLFNLIWLLLLPYKCYSIVHSPVNLLHTNIPESVSWGTRTQDKA